MGVFQLLAGRVMLKITLRINKTAISLVTHFSPLWNIVRISVPLVNMVRISVQLPPGGQVGVTTVTWEIVSHWLSQKLT